MTFAVNVIGWVGVVALLLAYWLVSTHKTMGDSTTYQGMNLLGAILVLVNSSYYGAYPSVGVNAAWIAIGAYALAAAPRTGTARPGDRTNKNATIHVALQRVSVVSSRPFDEIVRRLMGTIGRPDITAFHDAMESATTVADLERVVQGAIGSSGLMEFARFDAGEVLRKERNGPSLRILRLVVGNPLLMKEMATVVPDAAAYAPVTILVDERSDGVHLSYDSMASLLAPYGSPTALAVASELDTRVVALLETAAQ